jgi:hypothetical protein
MSSVALSLDWPQNPFAPDSDAQLKARVDPAHGYTSWHD